MSNLKQKNLKRKLALSKFLIGFLVLSVVGLGSSVIAFADSPITGALYDTYSYNVSGTNLSSGTLEVRTYTDSMVVPYTTENDPQNMRYDYAGQFTTPLYLRLTLPPSWNGHRINGILSIAITATWVNHYYYAENQEFQQSLFWDFTERRNLRIDNQVIGDGLSVELANYSANTNNFSLNFTFDDFYIPLAPVYGYTLTVPLMLDYSFVAVGPSTGTLVTSSGRMTSFTTDTFLKTYNVRQANFTGPAFNLSNDYYTVLQAIEDTDLPAVAAYILDMIRGFTGTYTPADYEVLGAVDFQDFATSVMTALGSLVSDTTGQSTLTQLQSIISLLNQLLAQHGALELTLENYFDTITGQLHSTLTGEELADLIAMIGIMVAGEDVFFDGSWSTSAVSEATYDRWVSIISDAIAENLDFSNAVSASSIAAYESQAAAGESAYSGVETIESDLWGDVGTRWSGMNLSFGQGTLPAAVWFVGAVEDIWNRLGIWSYVITASVAVGIVTLWLGKMGYISNMVR